MAKKEKPFNNPFGGLKLGSEAPKKPQGGPPPARAPKPKPGAPPSVADEERALFLSSVGEVAPVRAGPRRVVEAKRPSLPHVPSEDDEVLAQLSELVAGDAPFDLSDSDEFIEGALANLDPGILRRLRAGEYALQGHIDLHGLTRPEAKAALEKFLVEARHQQKRCVLVVHGRGLHSENQVPVLKESVQVWLSRGRMGRQVLAFTSARPHDGGAGAVYVLLRR